MQEQAHLLAASGAFLRVLAVLLAADAALILLHILHDLRDMGLVGGPYWLESRLLLISEDHGLGEIFGYGKALAIAVGFLACYLKSRAPIFACLGLTFVVILLDDSLLLHEIFGHRLATALALEPAFGLRAQDLGELLVWFVLGSVVVPSLAVGFRRSRKRAQTLASIFLVLLAALVFFALMVDMLHILLHDGFRGAYRVWPLVEEGGELVVLSLICAAAVTAAFEIRGLLRPAGSAAP